MRKNENIALFDMDDTLCHYEKKLISDLNFLKSPEEDIISKIPNDNSPEYLKRRCDIIKTPISWWANLPIHNLGMDIWELAGDLGFRRMILTQGPKTNPNAWAGKKIWLDTHFGFDVEVTITRDKSLVYGKILVDDWPGYIEKWLEWRPRGLVIMPLNSYNYNFTHKQVISYNGENKEDVFSAMQKQLTKDDD